MSYYDPKEEDKAFLGFLFFVALLLSLLHAWQNNAARW